MLMWLIGAADFLYDLCVTSIIAASGRRCRRVGVLACDNLLWNEKC